MTTDEIEDYRLILVARSDGWYLAVVYDDGVGLIEDVKVG